MSGDEIYKIKPGHTIQLKTRGARSGRNHSGSYIGDSFLTTRVRELRWITPAEDIYIAYLDLERPKQVKPVSSGNQALATALPPLPAGSSCLETFTRTISAGGWGTSEFGPPWIVFTGAGYYPAGLSTDGRALFDPFGHTGDGRAYVDLVGGMTPIWEMTGDLILHSEFYGEAAFYVELMETDGMPAASDPAFFIAHSRTGGDTQIRVLTNIVGPTTQTSDFVVPNTLIAYNPDTDTITSSLQFRVRYDAAGFKMKTWRSVDDEPSAWDLYLTDTPASQYISLSLRFTDTGVTGPHVSYVVDNLAITEGCHATNQSIYGGA